MIAAHLRRPASELGSAWIASSLSGTSLPSKGSVTESPVFLSVGSSCAPCCACACAARPSSAAPNAHNGLNCMAIPSVAWLEDQRMGSDPAPQGAHRVGTGARSEEHTYELK